VYLAEYEGSEHTNQHNQSDWNNDDDDDDDDGTSD
jgi:hypothetical protein